MARRHFRKWSLRAGVLLGLAMGLLALSTAWALFRFSRTKDLYPQVSYAAPSFRPEVSWSEARPTGWVRLSAMPRAAWLAVIAAEDGGFFKHDGIEWDQSVAKIRADLEKRQFPHGISTLNQQIVKNIYFGARPAFSRKLQEAVVARRMDSELEKTRILEIYMNIAEWGPGIVGIGAAARYYYRKGPAQLSDYECATLANLLPNPRQRGQWLREGRIPSHLARSIRRTLRRLPSTERLVQSQRWAARSR